MKGNSIDMNHILDTLVIEGRLSDIHQPQEYDGKALLGVMRAPIIHNGVDTSGTVYQNDKKDVGMTVRFQSYDPRHANFGIDPEDYHKLFNLLANKTLRITVEVLD